MATKATNLTTTWVLVDPAPLFVQKQTSADVLVSLSSSLPAANAAGIKLSDESPEYNFAGTTLNVYARAVTGTARIVSATMT